MTIGAGRIKAAASSEKARGERKQRLTGQPWRLRQMPGGLRPRGFGPLSWPAVTPSVSWPLGKAADLAEKCDTFCEPFIILNDSLQIFRGGSAGQQQIGWLQQMQVDPSRTPPPFLEFEFEIYFRIITYIQVIVGSQWFIVVIVQGQT